MEWHPTTTRGVPIPLFISNPIRVSDWALIITTCEQAGEQHEEEPGCRVRVNQLHDLYNQDIMAEVQTQALKTQ